MKNVTFQQFQELDIRIGTVVKAEVPSWSHWVMKLTVDLGPEIGERTVFAGIMHFYKPDDVQGKQMPFVVNLEPKKIGPEGDYSQGMMMAASPVVNPPIMIGDEMALEGGEGRPATQPNIDSLSKRFMYRHGRRV